MTRREHYRDFYEGPACGSGGRTDGERPLGLVYGNCQAEALRVLLDASPTFPWQLVRMPPVHELTADDLGPLRRLLSVSTLLVAQPVKDGYRSLPLGVGEVTQELAPGSQVVRWPVVFYTGLFPWQALVRVADDVDPPGVPYHDLRTLTGRTPVEPDLAAVAERSVDELARRERHTDVGVADLVRGAGAGAVHTVNHPGNELMIALAQRVQAAVGAPRDAVDPGRVLLGAVRSPLEAGVLAALELDPSLAREDWLIGGEPVDPASIVEVQRAWYAQRPDAVAEGHRRYAEALPLLGLTAGV